MAAEMQYSENLVSKSVSHIEKIECHTQRIGRFSKKSHKSPIKGAIFKKINRALCK